MSSAPLVAACFFNDGREFDGQRLGLDALLLRFGRQVRRATQFRLRADGSAFAGPAMPIRARRIGIPPQLLDRPGFRV